MPVLSAIATVEAYCESKGYQQPATEYRFAPPRRWRFDAAWPEIKLALEFEGGVFVGGRHTRGVGFQNDCEKYSEAALLGWRVLRATPGQVKRGIVFEWLDRALTRYGIIARAA